MAKAAVKKHAHKPKPAAPAAPPVFKGKRTIIKRGTPPLPGASNIIVLKKGEDLLKALLPRYEAMQVDLPKMELFWSKVVTDSTFFDTREYPELSRMSSQWAVKENVPDVMQYRAKMNKLKTWIDHFKIGHDYELTVAEVTEIMS